MSPRAFCGTEPDAAARFVRECQLLAAACLPPTDSVRIACATWGALRAWPDVESPDVSRRLIRAVALLARRSLDEQRNQARKEKRDEICSESRVRAIHAVTVLSMHHRMPSVSLQAVADEINLTRWHLCQLLKRISGYGFQTHLAGFRLLSSISLLAYTSADVKAIAQSCGYAHAGDMDRHFQNWLRMTPTRFRRLHSGLTDADLRSA